MDKLHKLVFLIQRYIDKKWFGKITVMMENGNIVNLKVEENIKL